MNLFEIIVVISLIVIINVLMGWQFYMVAVRNHALAFIGASLFLPATLGSGIAIIYPLGSGQWEPSSEWVAVGAFLFAFLVIVSVGHLIMDTLDKTCLSHKR